MASTARIFTCCALFLGAGLSPALVSAQPPTASASSHFARVRSANPRLTALIAEAAERSPTFRALIASIEATDGIVFVEDGTCARGVTACLTWQVTLAGPYRMLFVRIDTRKSARDFMASAGHELQHALEVLVERGLRSTAAIQLFYMRGMSPESPRAVETAAAVAAGNAVFRETP